MRTTLQHLREAQKILFLLSNQHVELMEITMTATIGKDWKDFFKIACADARKPLFQRA